MKCSHLAGAGVALAWVAICGGFLPRQAQATVITKDIYNFGEQVGSISFPSFSGTGTADVSFNLNTPFGSFDQGDITELSWSINPANDVLTAITLDAFAGDNPCPNGPGACSNRTVELTLDSETPGRFGCSAENDNGTRMCSGEEEFIPDPFGVPVPEPSALVVLASGVLGITLMRRRG
jgi:hypothetical protein